MVSDVGSRVVKKTTGPPDHFITTYTHGVWGFKEKYRNQWEELGEGDVVVFHSTRTDTSGGSWPSGLIGYGIVASRDEKDEPLWRSEKRNDENGWPLLVWFSETRWCGNVDDIGSSPIETKNEETISEEVNALVADHLALSAIEDEFGYSFPVQSSVSGFSHERGILDALSDKGLTHVRYRDRNDGRRRVESATGEQPAAVSTTVADTVNTELDVSIQADRLFDGLYFPDEERSRIRANLESALSSGKHVVLTGPPGTGKTELAENLCRILDDSQLYTGYQMTTATADWSTFDTVGGYMPDEDADHERLEFTSGQVLRRFAGEGEWRNEPLVIDEINRADIDKAFGQLFTLLSGQGIQLPFRRGGEEIEVLPASAVEPGDELGAHEYVVPRSWRLVATMNSYDKTSLYEMSYAFMRRFAFVRVPVPAIPDDARGETVRHYADVWGVDASADERGAIQEIWAVTNRAGRDVGPALVKDMLLMVVRMEGPLDHRTGQAVVSYLLPQLEGLPDREEVVRELTENTRVNAAVVEDAAREMLNVKLAGTN